MKERSPEGGTQKRIIRTGLLALTLFSIIDIDQESLRAAPRAAAINQMAAIPPLIPEIIHKSPPTIEERLSRGVSYFIIPHPDDELAAWALVQRAKYPVFVLMTQGGQSHLCDKFGGRGSEKCKTERLKSWNTFLNNFYTEGEWEDAGPGIQKMETADSMRLIMDSPDQNLSVQEVTNAITVARKYGSTHGPEEFVVSANDRYGHPDHEAVNKAVSAYTALGRLAVNGKVDMFTNFGLEVEGFNELAACPGGPIDRAYGWLNDGHCWEVTDNAWRPFAVYRREQFVDFDRVGTVSP